MKRFTLVAFVLMLVLMVGVVGAQEEEKVLRLVSGPTGIPYLDPTHATDTQSNEIVEHTYTGLTRSNELTGELEPGLATSWEYDEAANVYTFTLMEGVPWVRFNPESGMVEEVMDADGNVRYVTAHDVIYGWQRELDPESAAEYSYIVAGWVEGGAEYNNGEGAWEDVKIMAVDDYTLQFTPTEVTAFVPMIYGLWIVNPLPQWAIDEFGDQWEDVGNYQSFGPYAVSEWNRNESITMVVNPYWPGSAGVPQANIDKIVLYILDEQAGMDLYEAGELDVVAVPSTELDRVKSDPVLSEELYIGPNLCSYYYGFNIEKEPFDNVHLRRALSMAVDRVDLVENVTQGGQEPAQWFARPGLAAAPTIDTHPDTGIWYDPEAALEELGMALADLGLASVDELPAITLMHNTSEGHARIATAIQQMWVEELGLEVQVANQEWSVYLDLLDEDPPQIFRLGWCPDYADVHNFTADVFMSTSGNNHTNYASEEFDALVTAAAVEQDYETRRDMYAQAEEMLVYEDAAIIPLYWYTSVNMTKPGVERTYSINGNQSYEKWDLK